MTSVGRPRQIDANDIARAGCELGMRNLSLKAVAAALGITPAALYRHVDGRWGLERLVGERMLEDLVIDDDPAHTTAQHLLALGLGLREFVLAHSGIAAYLQTLFPRGDAGRRLLAGEVRALTRRGYAPGAAVVVASAVAAMSIAYAAAEERQREHADGVEAQRLDAIAQLAGYADLGAAHASVPELDWADYVRLVLVAAIDGLLGAAPPGRPVAEIVEFLEAKGAGV
jgi:AcrR family transcriptional regulator